MKAKALLTSLLVVASLAGTAAASDRRHDRDHNPPGRVGGQGTNWENPPGWRGGPGASPDYREWRSKAYSHRDNRVAGGYYRCWLDNDRNPPGRAGGRGTNWENPPGWRGGPGASPDRFGRCR